MSGSPTAVALPTLTLFAPSGVLAEPAAARRASRWWNRAACRRTAATWIRSTA